MNARRFDVQCDVDIEQTPFSFHAHAVPDGVDIRPGDEVLVHDAPRVGFGEQVRCRCRATVTRAGLFTRGLARVQGLFALTELYEVGFEPKDAR
jgi:hypothetical protein